MCTTSVLMSFIMMLYSKIGLLFPDKMPIVQHVRISVLYIYIYIYNIYIYNGVICYLMYHIRWNGVYIRSASLRLYTYM